MISRQYSRKELQDETGLKGKELTAWIGKECQCGHMIRMRSFVDPAHSRRRENRYCFVATQAALQLPAA